MSRLTFKACRLPGSAAGLAVAWKNIPGIIPERINDVFYQRGMAGVTSFRDTDRTKPVVMTYKDLTQGRAASSIIEVLSPFVAFHAEVYPRKGKAKARFGCRFDLLHEATETSWVAAVEKARSKWIRAGRPIGGVTLRQDLKLRVAAYNELVA